MLTPYVAYLEKRYQPGCRNAQQLWCELDQRGYPGSDSQPTKWLSLHRAEDMPLNEKQKVVSQPLPNPPPIAVEKPLIELPSPQQLAWLMVPPVSSLKTVDRQLLMYVCQEPIIDQVNKLAKEFAAIVRGRHVDVLDDWLVRRQNSSAILLQQFGVRLHRIAEATGLRRCTSSPIYRMSNGHCGAVKPRGK